MLYINGKPFEGDKENPRESLGYTRPQPEDAQKVLSRMNKNKRAPQPSQLLIDYIKKEQEKRK